MLDRDGQKINTYLFHQLRISSALSSLSSPSKKSTMDQKNRHKSKPPSNCCHLSTVPMQYRAWTQCQICNEDYHKTYLGSCISDMMTCYCCHPMSCCNRITAIGLALPFRETVPKEYVAEELMAISKKEHCTEQ